MWTTKCKLAVYRGYITHLFLALHYRNCHESMECIGFIVFLLDEEFRGFTELIGVVLGCPNDPFLKFPLNSS